MCNQENERQDARRETTVNLQTPQRVSGFARHLTRGRSMGVCFSAMTQPRRTSTFWPILLKNSGPRENPKILKPVRAAATMRHEGIPRCCTRLLASSSGSLGARQPRIDLRTFTLREIASWLIWGVSTEWTPSRHLSFVSETAESGHCQRYVA